MQVECTLSTLPVAATYLLAVSGIDPQKLGKKVNKCISKNVKLLLYISLLTLQCNHLSSPKMSSVYPSIFSLTHKDQYLRLNFVTEYSVELLGSNKVEDIALSSNSLFPKNLWFSVRSSLVFRCCFSFV